MPIDAAWRTAHALPFHHAGTDKNRRGRVLLVGGSMFVPGALSLTGEAVLRSGAGKLQIATVDAAAMHLGVLVPEAAMIGLPTDEEGEIGLDAADRLIDAVRHCDCLLIGPGMVSKPSARALLEALLPVLREGQVAVLDAAAISCARALAPLIAAQEGRVILTPHHGEMASLTGIGMDDIDHDPRDSARAVAAEFEAIVVLKAAETVVAAPDGETLLYSSDCVGLATGGSGDVLAGIMAGLAARGADPIVAAAWAVWLHGEAGQAAARRVGPIGFLARDIPMEIPRLMTQIED
ncbi:MAG: NAD(P)H-hydrate dehydratase [Pseudomonadota bacterium]